MRTAGLRGSGGGDDNDDGVGVVGPRDSVTGRQDQYMAWPTTATLQTTTLRVCPETENKAAAF